MLAKAGSFVKSVSVAVPVAQSVTGLGFRPKALILWCSNGFVSGTFDLRNRFSLGISDGTTSYSIATEDIDAAATMATAQAMSATALQIIVPDAVVASCDLASFDNDGFTLSWTVNEAFGEIVNYLALGGSELSAKVVLHTMKTTSTGTLGVTGVGFVPDFAMHIWHGTPDTLPHVGAWGTNNCFGFGAMDGTSQWAVGVNAQDGVLTSDTARTQKTSAAIYQMHSGGTTLGVAAFSSWDADGFTLNWSSVDSADSVASLCLKGGDYVVGNFAKSVDAAPVTNTITGLGSNASAVLLASYMAAADATVRVNHLNLGLGASDGTSNVCLATTSEDGQANADCSNVTVTNKAFVKVNNYSDTIEAQCTVARAADGAIVTWDTNDAVAMETLFAAFGPFTSGGGGTGGGKGRGGGKGGGGGGSGPGPGGPPGKKSTDVFVSGRRRPTDAW